MTIRGQGGPQRITRAHPILFSDGEEDTVEAQAGDLELQAGAPEPEEAVSDLSHMRDKHDLETEPVVRPKSSKVSTPRDDAESIGVSQDFLLEIRLFMKQQQRNEKLLFDELKDLKATIFQKPQTEWESVEQISHQTHHPLPAPRPFPQSRGGRTLVSEPPHAQPVEHVSIMSPPSVSSFRRYHEPQIPSFVEGEDVESFFVRFERIARTWGLQANEWAAQMVTLLTGKALEAYVGMDEQRSSSYDDIKAAVLAKYNVTEETYRLRFRSFMVPAGENVRETYNRIKGLYKRWMRPEMRSKEQLGETIILEQYLRVLRPDVRIWVKEHQPWTGEEAAGLAERYLAAHRESPRTSKGTVGKDLRNLLIRLTEDFDEPVIPREKHRHLITLTVNGQPAQALVDTGSTQTLVKTDLLKDEMLNYTDTVCLGCVHGDEQIYPTVNVSIVIDEQAYLMRVGVVEKLAYDVVIGEDFPCLMKLVDLTAKSFAVVTRSQTKGLQPLPNAEDYLFGKAGKNKKSKRQRRQEKHRGKDKVPESLQSV
ncbi:Zinc finger and SCAN domain-containing protein 23 [Labeo rohita]|uniref:Zinc finger and SCAN domain-containing protein 23 n=1 Tax=Labeo rohita TaxID=84645 RepID=A0ABQ8M538_LABRO|nr:Zinc finger and SCAN domain-containing protein 23 [Labeo rohita]